MAINPISTTRLMGLSSGMDTESIIKNLMQVEQIKLNKQLRAQTTLQWRQDALKSVSKDMSSFRTTFLTALGADGMQQSGAYTSYNVAITGSKKDAINISATSEAAYMKVVVNKIVNLAKGAMAEGGRVSPAGQTELSEGNYVKLGDLSFANDLFVGTKTIQVPKTEQATKDGYLMFRGDNGNAYYKDDVTGDYFTYDSASDSYAAADVTGITLNPVMTEVKQQALGNHGELMFTGSDGKVYYQSLGDPTQYLDADYNPVSDVSGITMTAVMIKVMEDKVVDDDIIQFSINGVDFEFTKDTKMSEMFTAVNNSKAGVTMSYSRLTDSFTISTRETGAEKTLTIENKRGNAFGTNSAFAINETAVRDAAGDVTLDTDGNVIHNALKGENSVIYINGTRVERANNSFTIDGIRYTLNYETGTETAQEITDGRIDQGSIDPEIAITANLSKNVDASVDKIKKFIEGYNVMVNKLYSLVTEKKNSKYYALTDEEKSAMTETQIKEWDELAKSGLLRNDRNIQNVLSQLRQSFYTTVEAAGLSAQDIGLRTAYGSRSGEITINETDLRAALERDSDAVMRVFMGNPSSTDPADMGLLDRLDDILDKYIKNTKDNTLSSMEKDLTRLTNKISDMEARMITLEEKYYLKYAAMETALAKLQSQTDWISSMLGTTSNSK